MFNDCVQGFFQIHNRIIVVFVLWSEKNVSLFGIGVRIFQLDNRIVSRMWVKAAVFRVIGIHKVGFVRPH